jgi:hypothetical protein
MNMNAKRSRYKPQLLGTNSTFRFRSHIAPKVRGASGRANPGSQVESKMLKPVPCHVKPSVTLYFVSTQLLWRIQCVTTKYSRVSAMSLLLPIERRH